MYSHSKSRLRISICIFIRRSAHHDCRGISHIHFGSFRYLVHDSARLTLSSFGNLASNAHFRRVETTQAPCHTLLTATLNAHLVPLFDRPRQLSNDNLSSLKHQKRRTYQPKDELCPRQEPTRHDGLPQPHTWILHCHND